MTTRTAVLVAMAALLAFSLAVLASSPGTSSTQSRSIRDTMLHAVDHYTSIDAHYIQRFLVTSDGVERQLTVDLRRQPGVGATATFTRADGRAVKFITDGKQLVEHDLANDEYTVTRVTQPSLSQRTFSVWERLRVLLGKRKDAADPIVLQQEVTELPLGWVSTALFPQEWVLGTYDVSRVVDRGQQELLGRATQQLEVIAPNGRTFVVNADKETGVLLRVEILEHGKVSELIQATTFKVNGPIERSEFTIPDLAGKRVLNLR